jgi:hypothetical protein
MTLYEERVTYAPLVVFEYDHKPGDYCVMLSDSHMGGEQAATFEANGRSSDGYGWTDLALQVVRSQQPELESKLGFDPEAGMFVAYGTDLEALKALATRLHAAFHDLPALGVLVKNAPWDYD